MDTTDMHSATAPPKYWAFVSYSHHDSRWGRWLHRALENYRVPRRLVARSSRDGPIPARINPVFIDREELPTSSSLSGNIDAALASSRYLIVICSPHAAVSTWVNEEIIRFKKAGRADRVLCLIVSGEPNASDNPQLGELECFPRALRFNVTASGGIGEHRAEPIAADVRAGGDGVHRAKMKLVAGLLGVNFGNCILDKARLIIHYNSHGHHRTSLHERNRRSRASGKPHVARWSVLPALRFA